MTPLLFSKLSSQFDNRRTAELAYGRGKVTISGQEIPLNWHSGSTESGGPESQERSDISGNQLVEGNQEVITEVYDRANNEETFYSSEEEEKSWKR